MLPARTLTRLCVAAGQHLLFARKRQTFGGGTTFPSGALKRKPNQVTFGLVYIVCAVIPGIYIGAAISKSFASFLEENDLFVPSDDDDDED